MASDGPLAGVRVLDLCHFLAGPYATAALADLGADVIKVEDPGHPDEARTVGPCFRDQSLYFESLNWGKRSLAVSFTHPLGRYALLRVVHDADVVIDNYKPGVMARLGLTHDELAEVRPDIITCSLSGFGATGPHAGRPGYDYTIQARSGVMSLTGEPDGPPGKAGISYVDHSGGLAAALAVCAALVERGRTGEGRHIDLSLYDVQISMLSYLASWNLNDGYSPTRQPSGAHPSIVPAQTFATADGYLSLFIGNDPMWARFRDAVGDSRLDVSRYEASSGRLAERSELIGLLCDLLLQRTTGEWLVVLDAAGIPAERVNSLSDALSDAQIDARNLIVTNAAKGEPYRHVRGPVPLDDVRAAIPAPVLGADSESILAEAGIPADEIRAMRDAGAVFQPAHLAVEVLT
jgi:crotonobetainyl-CoA:carnitine CoA-transferase CaiB-like acyl-CoA transferase